MALGRPAKWGPPSVSVLETLEALDGKDEDRRAADLHLDRVRHVELARFHDRWHRVDELPSRVAVGADELEHGVDLVVFDAYQDRGIALLEEPAGGLQAGGAEWRPEAAQPCEEELPPSTQPPSRRREPSGCALWTAEEERAGSNQRVRYVVYNGQEATGMRNTHGLTLRGLLPIIGVMSLVGGRLVYGCRPIVVLWCESFGSC